MPSLSWAGSDHLNRRGMMLTAPHSTYRYRVEKLKRVVVGGVGGGGRCCCCCYCFWKWKCTVVNVFPSPKPPIKGGEFLISVVILTAFLYILHRNFNRSKREQCRPA